MGVMSFSKVLMVLGLICSGHLTIPGVNAAATAVLRPVRAHTVAAHAIHNGGDASTSVTAPGRDESGKQEAHRGPDPWLHECPQLEPLVPEETHSLSQMQTHLASRTFLHEAAERLSAAVQIDTTSRDEMQQVPGNDPRWDHMRPFANFLQRAFPLVHRNLLLERINTHGLLYTWQGTDKNLKPTMLLAHQDVVPVEPGTEGDWKYPPFSGHWDGRYVWGRGAIDCKSTLTALLESVEELLRAEYSPRRTVLLSFGFDEEISGLQGAGKIAQHLAQRYPNNGIAAVVDEGSGVVRSWWGSMAALVGVAEKGYLDVEISVVMPSGHSSLPPRDNSITVMADLIRELRANQFQPELSDSNPVAQTVFCAAQNDQRMPERERMEIARADRGEISLEDLAGYLVTSHPKVAGFLQTTRSIATVRGGTKLNVVPGTTTLRVNHRVSRFRRKAFTAGSSSSMLQVNYGSTTEEARSYLESIVRKYAESHRPNGQPITVAWGDKVIGSNQTISLVALPGSIE